MSAGPRAWWRRLSAKDVSPWDVDGALDRWAVEFRASTRRARRLRRAARRALKAGS